MFMYITYALIAMDAMLCTKPMSKRSMRMYKNNGIRNGKTLDYRRSIRNYVLAWDDLTWDCIIMHERRAHDSYMLRDALNDVYDDYAMPYVHASDSVYISSDGVAHCM